MAVQRMTVRRCRKPRDCQDPWCSHGQIAVGELYAEHITGPGHELLDNTHWLQYAECAGCFQQRTGKPLAREISPAPRRTR